MIPRLRHGDPSPGSPTFLELNFGSQLSLWAARRWVLDTNAGRCPRAMLAGAFDPAGVPAAALEVDHVLRAIASTARRDVRSEAPRPAASRLAASAVACACPEASAILLDWLRPAGARAAAAVAARFAVRLPSAALWVRATATRESDVWRAAPAAPRLH